MTSHVYALFPLKLKVDSTMRRAEKTEAELNRARCELRNYNEKYADTMNVSRALHDHNEALRRQAAVLKEKLQASENRVTGMTVELSTERALNHANRDRLAAWDRWTCSFHVVAADMPSAMCAERGRSRSHAGSE